MVQPHPPRTLALGLLAAALVAAFALPPAADPVAAAPAPGSLQLASSTRADVAAQEVPTLVGEAAALAEDTGPGPETAAVVAFGTKTATPAVNVPCTTPGNTGNRIAAVYVVFGTQKSRLSSVRPYIVDALKRANGIVYHSAKQTGGTRHLRLATDSSCQPSVATVRLPASAATSFANTASAMQAKGYTHPQRKYLLFAESRAICGLGQMYNDDKASGQNRNNRGPQFARVDLGCWSGSAVVHEIFHTLGAVQKTAPRTNTALHCRDERDVMCYPGAGGTSVYTSSACQTLLLDERLDCNKNDYFHTNPKAGSYLATRWNTARSSFLWGGGPAYQFAPNPVRGLTASTPTASSVRLAWSAPAVSTTKSGAYAYRIMRGSSLSTATRLTLTRYRYFTDNAPVRGSVTYWVIPYNAGGDGPATAVTMTR